MIATASQGKKLPLHSCMIFFAVEAPPGCTVQLILSQFSSTGMGRFSSSGSPISCTWRSHTRLQLPVKLLVRLLPGQPAYRGLNCAFLAILRLLLILALMLLGLILLLRNGRELHRCSVLLRLIVRSPLLQLRLRVQAELPLYEAGEAGD